MGSPLAVGQGAASSRSLRLKRRFGPLPAFGSVSTSSSQLPVSVPAALFGLRVLLRACSWSCLLRSRVMARCWREDDSLEVALRILKIPYPWKLEIGGAVVTGGKSDQLEVLEARVLRAKFGTKLTSAFSNGLAPNCVLRIPQPSEESGWRLASLLEPMVCGLCSGAVRSREGIALFPPPPEPCYGEGQAVRYQDRPTDELYALGMVSGPLDAVKELLAVDPWAKFDLGLSAPTSKEDVELLGFLDVSKSPFGAGLILILGLTKPVDGMDDPVGGKGGTPRDAQRFAERRSGFTRK